MSSRIHACLLPTMRPGLRRVHGHHYLFSATLLQEMVRDWATTTTTTPTTTTTTTTDGRLDGLDCYYILVGLILTSYGTDYHRSTIDLHTATYYILGLLNETTTYY